MTAATGRPRALARLSCGPRAVIAATIAAGALLTAVAGPAVAATAPPVPDVGLPSVPGPVVLVGTAGVTWRDVDPSRTPQLWQLLEHGATAAVAVRSIRSTACPVDGWLAISSGRLAADAPGDESDGCSAASLPAPGQVSDRWQTYLDQAARDDRGAELGLLGDTLAAAGVRVAAIGPGAALAIASRSGIAVGDTATTPDDPAELGTEVAAALGTHELVLVDVDGVDERSGSSPATQLALVDDRIGAVLGSVPDGATVVVASLADGADDPHLQVLAATGPALDGAYEDALLGSRSTRQPGLVQTTDVAPTLLSLLGVATPSLFVGSPVLPLDGAATPVERLQALRDYDDAAQAVSPSALWFFGGLLVLHLLTYAVGLVVLRRHDRAGDAATAQRARWLARLRVLLVWYACIPVATFPANLVPWWRAGWPFGALVAVVAAIAALLAAGALLGPWRRLLLGPLGFVGGVTAAVLALDVLTGSRLMISSLMGLQPLVAGRFYGLGNVAFALFATGCVLLATAAADALLLAGRRTTAVVAAVLVGVFAVVVDGAPGLGSDFGGPLALIPAFALLVVLLGRVRSSWRLGFGVALATVAVVAALALVDWMRPAADRTHLGRFVDAVANGETWQVIGRKLEQNATILFGTWTGILVPVIAIALGIAVLRTDLLRMPALQTSYARSPALRPGLLALLVLLALGFAVNDSGAAVPAAAATFALPLLVAVCAAVARTAPSGEPMSRTQRAGHAPRGSAPAHPVPPGDRAPRDLGDPVEPLR